MKKQNSIYLIMLGYGLLVALIATMAFGMNKDIYLGLLLGIGSLIVNYQLLAYIIDGFLTRKRTLSILPVGLGRFFIFGVAGWISFQQSQLCLLTFTIGILAMPISALVKTLWEVKNDSY